MQIQHDCTQCAHFRATIGNKYKIAATCNKSGAPIIHFRGECREYVPAK